MNDRIAEQPTKVNQVFAAQQRLEAEEAAKLKSQTDQLLYRDEMVQSQVDDLQADRLNVAMQYAAYGLLAGGVLGIIFGRN